MAYEFEDRASAATAVVGDEGLVGIAVFMGGESRLGRAVELRTAQPSPAGLFAIERTTVPQPPTLLPVD
jgi:hypothetical protein